MEAWLRQNPPRRAQYRSGRRAKHTGLTVIHTAENMLDEIGDDSGAEGVAQFIRTRTTPGSYHDLVDSDSSIKLVRYSDEAYQDGTGSNPFAMSISFAVRAADWETMKPERRRALLVQGAKAFQRQQLWLAKNGKPTTPLRRITKAESDAGKAGFISHGERDPGRRSDPGRYFPWSEFFAIIREVMNTVTPVAPAPAPVPTAKEADMDTTLVTADGVKIYKSHPYFGLGHVINPRELNALRAAGHVRLDQPIRRITDDQLLALQEMTQRETPA